jgi:hypothetical protein
MAEAETPLEAVGSVCEDAAASFAAGYDTSLRTLAAMRDRNPTPELATAVDQFAEQRARAIADYRRRCEAAGQPLAEALLPIPFGQAAPVRPSVFNLAAADARAFTEYLLSWLSDMIRDEAKAVAEYGEFETLLEEAARKFASDRVYAQFLRDTSVNLGQIIVDQQKHQSTFTKLRTEAETFPHRPSAIGTSAYGQGLGERVGGAAGGVAATAALTALGVPELAPVVAPAAVAAGAHAGKYMETTAVPAAAGAIGRATRRQIYGDIVEYGAAFTPEKRRAAIELAETYQAAGQSAFLFFDPAKDRWVVEVGEPTDTERSFIGQGRVHVIQPSPTPPRNPRTGERTDIPEDRERRLFLLFPGLEERGEFGAMRPTILDAIVGMDRSEYGAILLARAPEKAPCTCATTLEGKRLCTRSGAIGMLSQLQVERNCSEIIPAADGRLERVTALRVAQSICGAQVTAAEHPDPAERMAARIACLRVVIPSVGGPKQILP